MEKIKFRGVSLLDDKFIYGYLYEEETKAYIIDNQRKFIEVKKDTIGQFTNLLDKDNKEIYEGDIIEYEHIKKQLTIIDENEVTSPNITRNDNGQPLAYKPSKIIHYKGKGVIINGNTGTDINLQNGVHWWNCLKDNVLTRCKILGNIYDKK